MDGLLVIAALVVLAIPVAVVALLIGQAKIRTRLYDAEKQIEDLTTRLARGPSAPVVAEKTTAPEPASPSKPDPEPQTPPAAAAARAAPPPIVRQAPPAQTPPPEPRPPSPVAQALADLGPWLQQNWFYAVSAASLALAGIFLVQYGMENGFLPPRARVAAALAFGAGLIGVGEFIRRRFGDGEQSATAYLPSVFSGAGIVTLFGAILSARMLYDLIGGGAAMGGMVVVALVAVVLGWLHGPLLVAVGVIGAYAAPVVLESSNTDASPLFGFFAIVAMLGLGVDTLRRWGWI